MIEKRWLKMQADAIRKADYIDPDLYRKYGVKRGLRNADGTGVLLPSVDDIVDAIAKRDHIKVVPTGVHAQNMLGLSTQVPMNYVFLTNGYSKSLTVLGNIQVKFKQTSPKNISFQNKLAMLITYALRDYGQDNVSADQIEHIHTLLRQEPQEKVLKDLALMPVWIRNIVMQAYEQK